MEIVEHLHNINLTLIFHYLVLNHFLELIVKLLDKIGVTFEIVITLIRLLYCLFISLALPQILLFLLDARLSM